MANHMTGVLLKLLLFCILISNLCPAVWVCNTRCCAIRQALWPEELWWFGSLASLLFFALPQLALAAFIGQQDKFSIEKEYDL